MVQLYYIVGQYYIIKSSLCSVTHGEVGADDVKELFMK